MRDTHKVMIVLILVKFFVFGLDRTDTAFVSLPLICGVSVCNHIDIHSASINLMFDIHAACHIVYH